MYTYIYTVEYILIKKTACAAQWSKSSATRV